jgi:hypothetical protein
LDYIQNIIKTENVFKEKRRHFWRNFNLDESKLEWKEKNALKKSDSKDAKRIWIFLEKISNTAKGQRCKK